MPKFNPPDSFQFDKPAERRKLLQISDGTVGDVRHQGQKQGDSR